MPRSYFNEATRVQMPAMVHLTRLGYQYFGRMHEDMAGTVYDPDTNILIRIITKDNPNQLKRIRKLFSHQDKLYVFEDSAMMEVVFVLSGVYQFTRDQIRNDIVNVMNIPNLVCNKGIIEATLDLYASEPKLSFVDCYLAIITETTKEQPLWTFDQKLLARCPIAREP